MDKLFPNLSVAQSKFFDAHQDWLIPIPAFFIIAPKKEERKISSWDDFSEEEAKDFVLLLKEVRAAMREVLDIQTVYTIQNEDTEHNFHVWLFPRYPWMEKFGRGIDSVRAIMNHAREERNTKEIRNKVKKAAEEVETFMQQAGY